MQPAKDGGRSGPIQLGFSQATLTHSGGFWYCCGRQMNLIVQQPQQQRSDLKGYCSRLSLTNPMKQRYLDIHIAY